jgi:hypothetical protein
MPLTELVYCVTIIFTNILTFNSDFSFAKKSKVAGSQIWAAGGLTDLGEVIAYTGGLKIFQPQFIFPTKLICIQEMPFESWSGYQLYC